LNAKICKDCDQQKDEREFPHASSRLCRACHLQRAIHWSQLPWYDEWQMGKKKRKLTEAQKQNVIKAIEARKRAFVRRKSLTETQEAQKTGRSTLEGSNV